MFKDMRKEWIIALIGTMTALIIAVGGVWFFAQDSQVQAAGLIHAATSEGQMTVAQEFAPASQRLDQTAQTNHPVSLQNQASPRRDVASNRGKQVKSQGHRARGGRRSQIDHDALLADALGITVETLETARENAKDAALQQAVAEGLITQEQADRMQGREGNGSRGKRGFGPRGKFGSQDAQIDHQALLADALGISVAQLEAAQQTARDAAIQQALDEGLITQEQVDMKAAHEALKAYIDQETMMAEALGISVADLQTARKEDRSLRTLINELGFDRETLQANMKAAYETAIQQAITDGVITQAQADQILEGKGQGFRSKRGNRDGSGMQGRPGRRGQGGEGQNNNTTPANDA